MVDLDPSVVTSLIDDHEAIRTHLLADGQVSFSAALETSIPKVALLSAASWIEDRVQQIVLELFEETMPDAPHRVAFVRAAAVERRYHSWFSWDAANANRFFSLFGPDFKAFCTEQAKASPTLESDIAAFMELGRLRNTMVHENFAAFGLSKSLAEVRDLFDSALRFVQSLPELLRLKPPLAPTGRGAQTAELE